MPKSKNKTIEQLTKELAAAVEREEELTEKPKGFGGKGSSAPKSDRPMAPMTATVAIVRDVGDPSWSDEQSEIYNIDEHGKPFPLGTRLAEGDELGQQLRKELLSCARKNKSTGRWSKLRYDPPTGCWRGSTKLMPKWIVEGDYTTTHEAIQALRS